MNASTTFFVIAKDGASGVGELCPDANGERLLVTMETGERLWASRSALRPRADGAFDFDGPAALTAELAAGESLVVPVVREELTVEKRAVISGRVRITKDVRTREESVQVPLLSEHVHVERVAVGREVEAMPAVRHEGDTMVIPVVEETYVVRKRLVLKEEIRVTKTATYESCKPQVVVLREETARVERVGEDAALRPKGE